MRKAINVSASVAQIAVAFPPWFEKHWLCAKMARLTYVLMIFFVAVSNRVTTSDIQESTTATSNTIDLLKSEEIQDLTPVITIAAIKTKLAESGVFDWTDATLTETEKKELNKLFDAVEIMTTSRNRQPSSAQNIFATLRVVERVVNKQLKEGQISEALAKRFNWENVLTRQKRGLLLFLKKHSSTTPPPTTIDELSREHVS